MFVFAIWHLRFCWTFNKTFCAFQSTKLRVGDRSAMNLWVRVVQPNGIDETSVCCPAEELLCSVSSNADTDSFPSSGITPVRFGSDGICLDLLPWWRIFWISLFPEGIRVADVFFSLDRSSLSSDLTAIYPIFFFSWSGPVIGISGYLLLISEYVALQPSFLPLPSISLAVLISSRNASGITNAGARIRPFAVHVKEHNAFWVMLLHTVGCF
jgi:hypothetical protein